MTVREKNIVPCCVCGEKPKYEERERGAVIVCVNRKCAGTFYIFECKDPDEAVRRWNRMHTNKTENER